MKEYSQFKLVNIPLRVNETNQDDCKPYANDICYMHIQLSETTFRYKTWVYFNNTNRWGKYVFFFVDKWHCTIMTSTVLLLKPEFAKDVDG